MDSLPLIVLDSSGTCVLVVSFAARHWALISFVERCAKGMRLVCISEMLLPDPSHLASKQMEAKKSKPSRNPEHPLIAKTANFGYSSE